MFEQLDIIITILLVALFGTACAFFSHLLDYCLWPNSIFGKYLPWLAGRLVKAFFPAEYNQLNRGNKEARDQALMDAAEKVFLYKVLGGCVVCTNVWIAINSYVIINLIMDIGWLYGIVYIVTSSFVLRKIEKI
jgi:uncharacterized membrane protein